MVVMEMGDDDMADRLPGVQLSGLCHHAHRGASSRRRLDSYEKRVELDKKGIVGARQEMHAGREHRVACCLRRARVCLRRLGRDLLCRNAQGYLSHRAHPDAGHPFLDVPERKANRTYTAPIVITDAVYVVP